MSDPTLSITDNGDGTATATIGSADGAAVALYSQLPGSTWTSRGTRTGNGTISPTVTPAGYWWKATATTTGTGSPGNDEIIDVGPAVTLSGEGVEPRICMMDSTHAIVIYDYGSHPRPLKAVGASIAADGRWTLGSEITVVTTSYGRHKICRMTDAKAIVVYDSAGGSLKAKCLSLSGVTVSAGAELAVSSASVAIYPDVERMDDDKGIVAYGSSGSIALKCLTISGTSLSAGAEATISDATYNAVALASLSASSATLAATTSAGVLTAAAVALSGTTITTGTAITVDTGVAGNVCSDGLSSTKSILCWKAGTGYTSGAVLTVSGTDISAGTTATSTDTATTGVSAVTALSSTVALSLTAGSNGGTIRSATISGTAITWGTGNAVAGISGGNCVQTDIDAISSTRAVLSCSINYPIAQEITYLAAAASSPASDTTLTSNLVWQPVTSSATERTRQYLRDGVANAVLTVCKQLGTTITLTTPSADPLTLWAQILPASEVTIARVGTTDTYAIGLAIPRQSNFPMSGGIRTGAQVTINSIEYQVDSVAWDNEDINMAAVCTLRCGKFGYTVEME